MTRREKRWRRFLSADDILHFRIVRENGEVLEIAIVYELIIEGASYEVCRIDNAHGQIHMNRVNARGEKAERIPLQDIAPKLMIPKGLEILLDLVSRERDRLLTELGISLA